MKSVPKISVVLMVLTPTNFLRDMTEFAIKTLRNHADDPDFELIVVEADGNWFEQYSRETYHFEAMPSAQRIDKYLNFTPKIGGVKELNAGIDACTGEFIVFTGNDVFVPPHWDTELLRVFEERPDCGIASLSAKEPGAPVIGPAVPADMVVEGMYSPFCMWKNQPGDTRPYRMDEAFIKIYQDSDFVMRMYESDLRAYRSCRAHVIHLGRMTSDTVEPLKHQRELAIDEKTFYDRWGNSPLMIFGLIRMGQWQYGQEHQSLRNAIHRHQIPGE